MSCRLPPTKATSLTRNATQKEGIESSTLFDRLTLGSMALLTVLDALQVSGVGFAGVSLLTAALSALRARRWGAEHSFREPLLWVLHLGYFFIPLGLGLRALAAFEWVTTSAALHALTTGAIGTLTLGMMARVSLGHTGRPLRADKVLAAAFALVVLAAIVRVVGAIAAGTTAMPSLHVSATLWALAFALYLFRAFGALVGPRPDGRPG